MNVDIDYNDELERLNTDPRLLPNPDKEKPFIPTIRPNSTIRRSKTPNCRRSVLGSPILKSESGRSHVEPNHDKTKISKIPVTNANHVSWADMVRRNNTQLEDTTKPKPQDMNSTSRRFASRMARLTGI